MDSKSIQHADPRLQARLNDAVQTREQESKQAT